MQFDLNTLYQNVFGYVGLPYPIGKLDTHPFIRIGGLKDGELNTKDLLGRPVPMPVKLNDTLTLPNAVISISGKKNITETPLLGTSRRGTVKEMITTEDYSIQVRGIIVSENDDFPENVIKEIRKIFELRKTITIECPICQTFDINKIVITDFNLPEIRGIHAQAYEINAISDDDFTVELLNE